MQEKDVTDRTLEVQDKKRVDSSQEQTIEGIFYRPLTDIFERPELLTIVMELPGVDREHIDIELDRGRLTVTGRIGLERYSELAPIYTEYEIGHFARSFQLSNLVDQDGIEASVKDGVLTLTLPKVKEAVPRRIEIR